jgi:hypothetical protein
MATSPKGKLLASSADLEGIKKMIGEYWYSKDVALHKTGDDTWSVANAKGVQKGYRVVLKGGRYRFEQMPETKAEAIVARLGEGEDQKARLDAQIKQLKDDILQAERDVRNAPGNTDAEKLADMRAELAKWKSWLPDLQKKRAALK